MARSYKTVRVRRAAVERLACPMCGWIRTVNYGISQRTGLAREVRFDKIDVEHALIWRLERLSGRGRGSREATIELLEGKTLAELPAEVKEQIRLQCHKILAKL